MLTCSWFWLMYFEGGWEVLNLVRLFVLNRDGQHGAGSKREQQTVQGDQEQLAELLSHSHSQQAEGPTISNQVRQRVEGSKVRQQRGRRENALEEKNLVNILVLCVIVTSYVYFVHD